jgi:hypothetical protein
VPSNYLVLGLKFDSLIASGRETPLALQLLPRSRRERILNGERERHKGLACLYSKLTGWRWTPALFCSGRRLPIIRMATSVNIPVAQLHPARSAGSQVTDLIPPGAFADRQDLRNWLKQFL